MQANFRNQARSLLALSGGINLVIGTHTIVMQLPNLFGLTVSLWCRCSTISFVIEVIGMSSTRTFQGAPGNPGTRRAPYTMAAL